MKFIRVTNSAKEVNRLSLEKLGFSTKRENVETIGQFGSGIKFAPIAAIRKGMRWVFTGTDSKGNYILEYVIKDDEGIPCVFYKYEDYEKPSSFTADAGILSWEEPFQILREVVANAIDQASLTETDWSIDLVDESDIKYTDGEFSVFITADESLLEVYNDFDKYFSMNKKPIYNAPGSYTGFKIYEPIDNYLRVYCKGILVYSTNREEIEDTEIGKSALYDYEFSNLELNEERTVKSMFDLNYKIANALSRIEDNKIVANLITNILDNKSDSLYEFNALSDFSLSQSNEITTPIWKKMFEQLYPNHVIVDKVNSNVNSLETIKAKGFQPLVIDNENKYLFLTSKGIPTALNTIGETFKYQYTTDIENYSMLVDAVNVVVNVFKDAKDIYPKYLGVLTDEVDNIAGMTLNFNSDGNKIILISEGFIYKSSFEEIVATLIHELDHYVSGIDDGNVMGRAFRDLADRRLAELAIKMYSIKEKNGDLNENF